MKQNSPYICLLQYTVMLPIETKKNFSQFTLGSMNKVTVFFKLLRKVYAHEILIDIILTTIGLVRSVWAIQNKITVLVCWNTALRYDTGDTCHKK